MQGQGFNPYGGNAGLFNQFGNQQLVDQFGNKCKLEPPLLIVESADTATSQPPLTVGIITNKCHPIQRFVNTQSVTWTTSGVDPAIVQANVNFPAPPVIPPPIPPPTPPAFGPASFLRLGRSAALTIPIVVGVNTTVIPFPAVDATNDAVTLVPNGIGVVVTEAGTYDVNVRLPVPLTLGLAASSSLQLLVNGVAILPADLVNVPVGLAMVVGHILSVPVALAAGDVVTVQLVTTALLAVAITLPIAQGYFNITRTQNLVVAP